MSRKNQESLVLILPAKEEGEAVRVTGTGASPMRGRGQEGQGREAGVRRKG